MTFIENYKKNKKSLIYTATIFGVIVIILLLLTTSSSKLDINVPLKDALSTQMQSKISVPQNYDVQNNINSFNNESTGYNQILTSPDKNLTIYIKAIPNEVKRENLTGGDLTQRPVDELKDSVKYITTIGGVQLYREDENVKSKLANEEISKNGLTSYLSFDKSMLFNYYAKDSDGNYTNDFPTKKNGSVTINGSIKFNVDTRTFASLVQQMDAIIKTLDI